MPSFGHFSTLNFLILSLYLSILVGIGVWLGRRQKTTEDYFLAGRNMPWLAVGVSMFASLTSASSFMGVPGLAYQENISMIAGAILSPLVAPILIFVFYPFYRQLRVTTSYQYIDRRYGAPARFAVATLFCLARLGWLGVVIYSPSLALSVVTGMNLYLAIFLMGIIATSYAVLGGLSAVIWTDVLQFTFLVGGAVWLAVSLLHGVPEGWSGILEVGREAQRLAVWDWRLDWFEMTALAVAISYFFQFMQDYGVDQVSVQRLLSVPTFSGMVKATVLNSLIDLTLIALLLFLGLGMFAYFQAFPDRLAPDLTGDQILPYYVIHALPNGVSGLLITAILAAAMSSLDSGINSLSTVILNDFVQPLRKKARTAAQDLRLARLLTLGLGAFAIGVACHTVQIGQILKAASAFLSLFGGPVLSLFLLGMLSTRTHFKGRAIATLPTLAVSIWLQNWTSVHFIYYFPVSFGMSFLVGYAASLMTRGPAAKPELTLWGRSSWRSS